MTDQTVHNRPTSAAEMMDEMNSETAKLHYSHHKTKQVAILFVYTLKIWQR